MKQKLNRVLFFFKEKTLFFLEKTSYKTRRSTAILQKKEQIEQVLGQSDEEFLLDYEEAIARYEHTKLFFGVPVFVLFLTVLWVIFKTIAKIMNLQAEGVLAGNDLETIQTVSMVGLVALTIIVSIFFIVSSNHIYMLSKKKIFYEEMKNKREGKQ